MRRGFSFFAEALKEEKGSLDVLVMFGAYTTARGMAISRLVIRFFWFGFSSVAVTYIYLKVLHERNDYSNDHSIFGYTVYAALRLVLALLLKFAACRLRANHLMTKSFTIPC